MIRGRDGGGKKQESGHARRVIMYSTRCGQPFIDCSTNGACDVGLEATHWPRGGHGACCLCWTSDVHVCHDACWAMSLQPCHSGLHLALFWRHVHVRTSRSAIIAPRKARSPSRRRSRCTRVSLTSVSKAKLASQVAPVLLSWTIRISEPHPSSHANQTGA